MNCESKVLALWAIATTLLTQGRGSQRYDSRSLTGSSQNECFLLPQRSQSSSISAEISHSVQKCCKHTRLGTCSVADSDTSVSCVFRNRRKQIIHYRCEVLRSLTSICSRNAQFPGSVHISHSVVWNIHAFFLVIGLPQVTQFLLCSRIIFPLKLCIWPLKFLLHDSHKIRKSVNAHGETDVHSLHGSSYLCVTSLSDPLSIRELGCVTFSRTLKWHLPKIDLFVRN